MNEYSITTDINGIGYHKIRTNQTRKQVQMQIHCKQVACKILLED